MPCSASTSFYPVGLNLAGKTVVVVGAGQVAYRKLTRLLHHACKIIVVSPSLSEDCALLLQEPNLTVVAEPYQPKFLDECAPDLVFACTSDAGVNRQVVEDCQQRGIWVNSATEGASLSDFILPALTQYDDLQIALFSGGASPLLVRKLREDIESLVGPWMGPYLLVLKAIRQELQTKIADEHQRKVFYEKVLSDEVLLQAIQSGPSDTDALTQDTLKRLLSEQGTLYGG